MERDFDTIVGYIGKSINRAIDFMVDRAWFDLVSLTANVMIPDATGSPSQRVLFVLLFTLILFGIRESITRVHAKNS